jgi:hypothetical protein
MPPTRTAVADDGWDRNDWKKILAVVTIVGTGYKIYKVRKVGPSEVVVTLMALWGLFGGS